MKTKIAALFFFLLFFIAASSSWAVQKIFVSIPPQKYLVDRIGGELVQCNVLVGEGKDPHTFEPSPRQVASLAGADFWFTTEMEFEMMLKEKVQHSAKSLTIIDLSHHVEKIAFAPGAHHHGHDEHKDDHEAKDHHDEHKDDHEAKDHHDEHKDGHEAKDHHDEHKDEHQADTHHDGHHDNELDPHVWLSPLNLQVMSQELAEALIAKDPANKDAYKSNLQSFLAELEQLHQTILAKLKPFHGESFYVYHPSFGYFAHTYGLVQEPVEIEGKSPGPKHLARLIKQAREDNVKVIFVQPQFDPKSGKAVAQAIGGRVVPLDALAENVVENIATMADKIEAALTE